MTKPGKTLPHRGAADNPPNRFEPILLERDPDWNPEDDPLPQTQFFRDASQSIISYNDSPDIAFDASINPYRGCEHGCVYCYARPTHEYLGFSSGLDFETKIMVKLDAAKLLRAELASRKWKPQVLAMCGVTDAYQPIERRLRLTRACLEVLAECRNPVAIVTKNRLVTRDIDFLSELALHQAAVVYLSLTTLDTDLRAVLEPRTSPPAARLAAMRELREAGVPVGALVAPVIPGLNDHELPALLGAAAEAGARFASYVVLRLPFSVAPMFEQWLGVHVPAKKDRVMNRIRSVRGGGLNDSRFERRMEGTGVFAEQISHLFDVACRKHGLNESVPELSTASFRHPEPGGQMRLFD